MPGWNFVDNNSDAHDVNGHGTLTAGVLSVSNNSSYVAGVAWNSKLMPLRVGTMFDTANALIFAADHGARVAVVGLELTNTPGTAIGAAAQYFVDHGGVVVATAGQSGVVRTDANDPAIITVSAGTPEIASSYQLTPNANTGTPVDMSASCTMWTMYPGDSSAALVMTPSISAALVGGVAALVLSVKPSLTGPELSDLLVHATDDVGAPGFDLQFGAGRVNALRALTLAGGSSSGGGTTTTTDTIAPTVSITSPANGAHVGNGKITIAASASDNVGVVRVDFFVDGALKASKTTAPYAFSMKFPTGAHAIVAKARDAAGNVGTSSTVTVVK